MKKAIKIISVGGSIIIPKTGFDIPFLKKFRQLILRQIKKGERFILVIGGGAICRKYQDAAKQIVSLSDTDLDWIGIHKRAVTKSDTSNNSYVTAYTHERRMKSRSDKKTHTSIIHCNH